jgi:hypothetical protein
MNPLTSLSPALYAALLGLAVKGASVPVYEHSVPTGLKFWVLLGSPAIISASGRSGCRSWTCEVVIQVITRFPTDTLSSVPANLIADQVLLCLAGVALVMPEPWQCMPGLLLPAGEGEQAAADTPRQVVRRLRLRWDLYYHSVATLPVPPTPPPSTRASSYAAAAYSTFSYA